MLLEKLTIQGLLKRIDYHEMAEVMDEEYQIPLTIKRSQNTDKAVVFKGKRTPFPIASNIVDTRKKLLRAAGLEDTEKLYDKLASLPPSVDAAFEKASFEDYYDKIGLSAWQLGALKYYEKDRGFYITSGVIVAQSGKSYNASIHRMLIVDDRHLAVRIVPRQLYSLVKEKRRMGEETPITILLGNHPLFTLVSSATPPIGYYELAYLASFMGERIPAVSTPTHNHLVPVGPSVIVEAYVTLEDVEEGPFVDAMGTYDRVRRQPLVRIESCWKLIDSKPYYHAILPGGNEHSLLMGVPREAQIWRAVQNTVPKVGGVRLTRASGGWLHAVISIEKNHDEDGKNAIMAAFAAHPSLKHVVVVDTDINIDEPEMVEWAIATRFQASKDLIVIPRARGSTLDPSAQDGITSKMGIDATKPLSSPITYERARIPGE